MKSKFLSGSRIDCVLIWGHGIQYFDDIIRDINSNKNFDIVKIQKHKPKNTKSFVKEIYSYDYVPFWHLKNKTKYLLNSPQEVCFIFIRNLNSNEDFYGEGYFRHRESSTLKIFKEELRDKYNPYESGKRTHNHVIHATDSEAQADHMLKYLGYDEGVELFESENKFIDLPYYIKGYKKFEFKLIDVNYIFCNIVEGESWFSFNSKTVHIKESPQYRGLCENISVYKDYINKYLGGALQENYTPERYRDLSENFEYLKEPYQNSFVDVELVGDKYIIVDGVHRACSHIYQGNTEITVCQILE